MSRIKIEIEINNNNKFSTSLNKLANSHIFVGKKLILDTNYTDKNPLRIHEFSSFILYVTAPLSYGFPIVLLGVKKLDIFQLSTNEDLRSFYKIQDNISDPFKNQLGFIDILLNFPHKEEVFSFTLEILSSKSTFDDARHMLQTIQSVDRDIANMCFSQSKLSSANVSSEKIDILKKISFALSILDFLDKNKLLFKSNPCFNYEKKSIKVNYKRDQHHIDERGIQWLTRNSQELSINTLDNDLDIFNVPMKINEIEVYQPNYNTDCFENRVLHSFLQSIQLFFHGIIFNDIENIKENFDLEVYDIKLLQKDWSEIITTPQVLAKDGLKKLSTLWSFFNHYLPCKNSKKERPKITNDVKKRLHYLEFFLMVNEFYQIGQPIWHSGQYLSGLKNLSKIYEFYVLINIIKKIRESGFDLIYSSYVNDEGVESEKPHSEPRNKYSFENKNGKKIELLYEPIIINYNQEKTYHNLHKMTKSVDVFGKKFLKPDFIMLFENKFIILDAKYSTDRSVDEYHLPLIMNKYGIGIKRSIGEQLKDPDGVIAVYAKSNNQPQFLQRLFIDSKLKMTSLYWSGKLYLSPNYNGDPNIGVFNYIKEIIQDCVD